MTDLIATFIAGSAVGYFVLYPAIEMIWRSRP